MTKASNKLKVVASEPIDDISAETAAGKDAVGKKDDKETTDSTAAAAAAAAAAADTKDAASAGDAKADEGADADTPPKVPEKDLKLEDDDEPGPPPPARPTSPRTKALNELKEAFPSIEEKILKAVLIASSGELDPAFNALLYLSDPSYEPEIPVSTSAVAPAAATAQPGRISTHTNATLTDDEILARKLQKEFEREERESRVRSRRRRSERSSASGASQGNPDSGELSDEFGQIKENFAQGLEEARTTLNGWVSGLAKKFSDLTEDEKAEQYEQQHQQQQRQSGGARRSGETAQTAAGANKQNPKLFGALGGSSYTKKATRFDDDPVILSNDFHNRISLNDNDQDDDEPAPTLPKRKSQEQSDSFTEPKPATNKWQPLNSEAPVNSDAFLVTDSEEETDNDNTKKTDK